MASVAFDYRDSTTAPDNNDCDVVAAIPKLYALRRGLPVYFASLLDDQDEILRVAGMAALLDLGAMTADRFPLLVAMAHFGAVQSRAFVYFRDNFEYARAAEVAASAVADGKNLQGRRMAAELAEDQQALIGIYAELFLAEGVVSHLHSAKRSAEAVGGWRAALPWALRILLAQPADPFGCFTLLRTLIDANQFDVVDGVLAAFERVKLYPIETAIFGARTLSARGHYKAAVQRLSPTDGKINDPRLAQVAAQYRAEALAGDGDFRAALAWYETQNLAGRPSSADPAAFARAISHRARYRFPELPPDPNADTHVMMVGFPRSGTTLLESAIGGHPGVEAFEEIPALLSGLMLIDRDVTDGRVALEAAIEARERYYGEIRRRSRKSSARYFVDKLPLNAAHVNVTRHLFPKKKYIFSIRHPYDVALSCFKQLFQSNVGMENFRNIADTVRLYDFVMTQWFDVFPFEDNEYVCYVRYEELVLDFKNTLDRVLRFIGVEWRDEVARFAEHAERRAATTPSYQKVRSGLAIGVQTSWEDYRFVFDRKEAQPLKRWVDDFGYGEAAPKVPAAAAQA